MHFSLVRNHLEFAEVQQLFRVVSMPKNYHIILALGLEWRNYYACIFRVAFHNNYWSTKVTVLEFSIIMNCQNKIKV